MRLCARQDCAHVGETHWWQPVLLLYAQPHTTPAQAFIPFNVCDSCKARLTVADFMTEQSFAQVASAFARQGRARPLLHLTELTWRQLTGTSFIPTPTGLIN